MDDEGYRGQKMHQNFKVVHPKRPLPLPMPRNSVDLSWSRGLAKSELETTLSPIHLLPGHLAPLENGWGVSISASQRGHVWALSMSEQLYYSNSLLLLNKVISGLTFSYSGLIRNQIQPRTVKELAFDWTNVKELGVGAFGIVMKVDDVVSGNRYAVKLMTPSDEHDLPGQCEHSLVFLRERNALVRARESQFVVRMERSMRVKALGVLMLVFEFCIGDLSIFVETAFNYNAANLGLSMWQGQPRATMIDYANLKLRSQPGWDGADLIYMAAIYILELWCAIDFLATIGVVHRDIKLDNLMITEQLHLKLGDFGLVVNTEWVTHQSQANFLYLKDLENRPRKGSPEIAGTIEYLDLEALWHVFCRSNKEAAEEIHTLSGSLLEPCNIAAICPPPAIPLADIWAAGLVACSVLLMGFQIHNERMAPTEMIEYMSMFGDHPLEFPLRLMMIKELNERYIQNGLKVVTNYIFPDTVRFLCSIFKPRSTRCRGYRRKQTFLGGTTEFVLNLDAVEDLDLFRSFKLNRQNVSLVPVPPQLHFLYNRDDSDDSSTIYPTFKMFLDVWRKNHRLGPDLEDRAAITTLLIGTDMSFI